MEQDWYVRVNDQIRGPVSSSALRELATSGRLGRGDHVRRGDAGDWVIADRCRGLFEPAQAPASPHLKAVRRVGACVSREEKKKRFGVALTNGLIWFALALATVATMGGLLVLWAITWALNHLLSEYHVRKLQALGTTATETQFPEVVHALHEVCEQFGVADCPKVIILNMSETNAFAIRFARKKVIVLLSEMLEGILERPAELRFILGHELAHIVLDHGARGRFELYKPAGYKAAREMTCDNCGCAAAGDLGAAKTALKRLGVGNALHDRLDEPTLAAEAEHIYSGLTGWLLKQYLTYPPLGKRLGNIAEFDAALA